MGRIASGRTVLLASGILLRALGDLQGQPPRRDSKWPPSGPTSWEPREQALRCSKADASRLKPSRETADSRPFNCKTFRLPEHRSGLIRNVTTLKQRRPAGKNRPGADSAPGPPR